MLVDYCEVFKNCDELADFLMLSNSEQLDFLTKQESNIKSLVSVCDFNKKTKQEK